jgi:DNA-binding LytR/AlgR family response regulator
MHIAICDDNIADRKQMERLLARESDRRAVTSGVLYIDSFGNAPALLHNPMLYDVFYIDLCKTAGVTGMDVVASLVGKGVHAPIIMCCSALNYRTYSFPDNVLFLDKPIQTGRLTQSLDHALSILEKAQPLIELRSENETVYVTEPDILYAVQDGRNVHVTLLDGRCVAIADTADNFFQQVESHPTFFSPTVKVVINGRYMQDLHRRKATMCDGAVFKISPACMAYAKELLLTKQ